MLVLTRRSQQSIMIGNVIADQFRGVGANWPLGAALAFVMIAIVTWLPFIVANVHLSASVARFVSVDVML